jgi:uncharacterized protein (TIGR02270 family)
MVQKILTQHAEEAVFLWLLRDMAVGAPDYSPANLAKLDGRLEAHVDGLRVAGVPGWEICRDGFSWAEPGEIFAGLAVAFEISDTAPTHAVFETAVQSLELSRGVISALGWLGGDRALPHIRLLLQSEEPIRRRIGIAAAAIHRRHPGETLTRLVRSENPLVRARALKAVGDLGDTSQRANVESALRDADAECRFGAAWSGALLGLSTAVPVLQEIAESGSPRAVAAAGLALRRMDLSAAHSWQKGLASDPKRMRLAIIAADVTGDPSFVPWLISLMGQLPLARKGVSSWYWQQDVDCR